MNTFKRGVSVGFAVMLASTFVLPSRALAHCDTLGGPVIADAQAALAKGDVTPVLKWVRLEAEEEIKNAFARALEVHGAGGAAAELADHYFFETLVRVHRAGEGAPFTGLKDDDAEIEPAIEAADNALSTGKIDGVVDDVTRRLAEGVRERFRLVVETQKHKDEDVASGRAFVAAYVDYVHFVERLYRETDLSAAQAAHGHEAEPQDH
jgi:hypothetical protein